MSNSESVSYARFDIDLEFLLKDDDSIKLIAKDNNTTEEIIRASFEDAIAKGITSVNQYEEYRRSMNE